jgi:hypothetical protein
LEECANRWFPDRSPLSDLALLYAMAHGRDEIEIARCYDYGYTRLAIRRFARRIRLPYEELVRAVDEFLEGDEPSDSLTKEIRAKWTKAKDQRAVPSDVWEVVSLLSAEYGEGPKFWFWKNAVRTVRTMYDKWYRRYLREHSEDGTDTPTDANDPRCEAHVLFQEAMEKFLEEVRNRV